MMQLMSSGEIIMTPDRPDVTPGSSREGQAAGGETYRSPYRAHPFVSGANSLFHDDSNTQRFDCRNSGSIGV